MKQPGENVTVLDKASLRVKCWVESFDGYTITARGPGLDQIEGRLFQVEVEVPVDEWPPLNADEFTPAPWAWVVIKPPVLQ